ncbi:MAG: hypothetical protein KGI06_03630 [Candidatus Micrarchaeota archaeon]|nr:hypothetical protein [Candidatus Micrarchaeota archaeon]
MPILLIIIQNASAVTVPSGIVVYVPITINNIQTSNVPSPFQEMITVNSMNYTSIESANLQNIEFFNSTGNIIPSWLESNNTNTSTRTIYWVELTNSILGRGNDANSMLPSSNVIIYMGFAPLATNLFSNTITGEAPQLSSTYAQYDTGANVFTFYDILHHYRQHDNHYSTVNLLNVISDNYNPADINNDNRINLIGFLYNDNTINDNRPVNLVFYNNINYFYHHDHIRIVHAFHDDNA